MSRQGGMGMQQAGRRRGDDLDPLVRKWVRDGAVRARLVFGELRTTLQARQSGAGHYMLRAVSNKEIGLSRLDKADNMLTGLARFPLREPILPGQEYELELHMVGETLTAKFNGEVLGTALFLLFARDFAPLETRMESILSRLEDAPRYLARSRERLRDPVRIWKSTRP